MISAQLRTAIGNLKNIRQDNVTGEIETRCGRVEFIKQMQKLIYMYWPDWKGLLHMAYPQVTQAISQAHQYITVRTTVDEPMRVDTTFGRGGAPETKTPARGLVQPKLLGAYCDQGKNDMVNIWIQSHDCIMDFEIFAKSTMEAQELSIRFLQFMRDTRHKYIRNCINNLVYLYYSEDKDQNLRFDESYRQAMFRYFIQYEDVWVERLPRIEAVTVENDLSILPRLLQDLPMHGLPEPQDGQAAILTTSVVSKSYSHLSIKTPPDETVA